MAIRTKRIVRMLAGVAFVAAIVGGPATAFAHEESVQGTLTTRLDTGFIMRTFDGTPVTVVIGDQTKIKIDDSSHRMPATELIPGLRVKVNGAYDSNMALVANEVKFSEADRRLALEIKAGLTPTDTQVAANTATIEKHGAELDQHGLTLGAHQMELTDHSNQIVATSGRVDRTNERIGSLDDFAVINTFTVHFKNGQWRVGKAYLPQIAEFANAAKGIEGYKVQVQGFASAPGKETLNDRLSAKRAETVTMVLQQDGIPAANLLVPVAMGETEQVAPNDTKAGQAENRRVVITVLQNKGIAAK